MIGITDRDRRKAVKQDMRKLSADLLDRKPDLTPANKLTCAKCGVRVRHLSLHLRRNHGIRDRAARKTMKDADFANQLGV